MKNLYVASLYRDRRCNVIQVSSTNFQSLNKQVRGLVKAHSKIWNVGVYKNGKYMLEYIVKNGRMYDLKHFEI